MNSRKLSPLWVVFAVAFVHPVSADERRTPKSAAIEAQFTMSMAMKLEAACDHLSLNSIAVRLFWLRVKEELNQLEDGGAKWLSPRYPSPDFEPHYEAFTERHGLTSPTTPLDFCRAGQAEHAMKTAIGSLLDFSE